MFILMFLFSLVSACLCLPLNSIDGPETFLQHPPSVNKDVFVSSKAADIIMLSETLNKEKISLNIGRMKQTESRMSQCSNSSDHEKCKTIQAIKGSSDLPQAKVLSESFGLTEVRAPNVRIQKLTKPELQKNTAVNQQSEAEEAITEQSIKKQSGNLKENSSLAEIIVNPEMPTKAQLDSSAALKPISTMKSHYTFVHPIPVSELFNKRSKPM